MQLFSCYDKVANRTMGARSNGWCFEAGGEGDFFGEA
jgi:hypothetical protein